MKGRQLVSHGQTLGCAGALSLAVQVITLLRLATQDLVTHSLAWPDPRSHRGVISCIPQAIIPMRELGSGHARLGETIVGHVQR